MRLKCLLPSIVMGILPLVLLSGCLSRKYDLPENDEGDAGVGDGAAADYGDVGRDSSLETVRPDGGRFESRFADTGIPDVFAVDGASLPADAQTVGEGEDAPLVIPQDGAADTPVQVVSPDARIEAAAVKTDTLLDTNKTTNPDVSRDVVVLDVSPDRSPDTALPPLLDAPVDAPTGCTIAGVPYPSGVKSDNVCLVCAPAINVGAWSNNADNTPCSTGYCRAGTCTEGCLIGTMFHRTGVVNTGVNSCQSCQPALSPTAWSPVENGLVCPDGVCNAGACADGCWLDGGFVRNGDRKLDNQCLACQSAVNPKAWQTLSNGESCGSGKVCSGTGTCSDGCWLGGTLVPEGPGSAPDHDCQECQPLVSTSQWQPRSEGTYCGTGTQFCSAGSCQTGCWIDGTFHASGAVNPANQCEICTPSLSLSSWVQRGVQDCSIITAGQHYTCTAVGGDARCWGANGMGQLGDDSTTRRTSPVQVVGLTSGVRAISSAGDSYHTCALVNGGVQCWGRNAHGELGNSSTGASHVPVPVSGLSSGVIGLSVGGSHTCALLTGGDIRCWGYNFSGQLGINPEVSMEEHAPGEAIVGLGGPVQAMALGQEHTCVLVGGGVKCWGSNSEGELGAPAVEGATHIPTSVALLTSGVKAISTSRRHTCALLTNGEVRCLGGRDEWTVGEQREAQFERSRHGAGTPGTGAGHRGGQHA